LPSISHNFKHFVLAEYVAVSVMSFP